MTATEMPSAGEAQLETDVFSELGSTLGDAYTEATNEAATAEAGAEEVPGGEAPTTPPAPGEAAPQTPGGEGPTADAPYQLSEDGNSYIVPKAEIATFNGMKEYATQVQNYFPTAQDAKFAADEQSDWRLLRSDFVAGGDQQIDQIIGYFMGNNAQDLNEKFQYQNSFARMAEKLPQALKALSDPNRPTFGKDVYSKIESSILNDRIEEAYQKAINEGDLNNPDDELLKVAQYLDWSVNGKFRTNDQTLQQQYRVQGLKPVDKREQEAQQLSQREQQIQKQAKDLQDRDFEGWNKQVLDGQKWAQFDAEIDKILAPVKDKYDPEIFSAVRRQTRDKVIDAIKQDALFARNHSSDRAMIESQFRNAWDRRENPAALQPRAQTYINDFLARVKKYTPSIAAPLLKNATAAAVAKPRAAQPTPKPRTAAPPNGQQPPAKPGHYNIFEDPEFKQYTTVK